MRFLTARVAALAFLLAAFAATAAMARGTVFSGNVSSQSRDAAVAAGYQPCTGCRP